MVITPHLSNAPLLVGFQFFLFFFRKVYQSTNSPRAFSLDPTIHPSPRTFNPGRYLSPSFPTYREPLTPYPSILKNTTFSWGRRVCQGAAFTKQELIAACGFQAWTFDLSCKEGEEGEVEGEMAQPGRREESLVIVKPRSFGLVCQIRGEGVGNERRRGGGEVVWGELGGGYFERCWECEC